MAPVAPVAAVFAGRLPDEQAWPPVATAEDDDPADVAALLQDTYDPDPRVRAWAVHRLCPCGLKRNRREAWTRLLAMVDDDDVKVRGQVLHVLCDGSPREREAEVVQAVEGMANDPDAGLRRRARKVLAQYRRGGRINVL